MILRDADGQEVATNTGPSGPLHIPKVHKWAPGEGYLYELEVQLVQGDTVVDSYTLSVGLRTVGVDVIKLVIGKGHQDRRGRSPAEREPVDLVPVVIL